MNISDLPPSRGDSLESALINHPASLSNRLAAGLMARAFAGTEGDDAVFLPFTSRDILDEVGTPLHNAQDEVLGLPSYLQERVVYQAIARVFIMCERRHVKRFFRSFGDYFGDMLGVDYLILETNNGNVGLYDITNELDTLEFHVLVWNHPFQSNDGNPFMCRFAFDEDHRMQPHLTSKGIEWVDLPREDNYKYQRYRFEHRRQ